MTESVHSHLRPVRRRQRWQSAVRAAVAGLLIGSCAAAVLAAARLFGAQLSPRAAISLPVAGLALGLLTGLAWRRTWKAAAAAVDAQYRLKDRAATALAFLDEPRPTVLHHLQIADAIEHLREVDARRVAPLGPPKALLYASAAFCAAALLVLIPV